MAITKKTFTVADTPVDAGWKKASASTHRKYPATKSQMTIFVRALFMMTSWLQGAGITHAMGRTTQAEQTTTEAFTVLELQSAPPAKVCSREATRKSFARSEPYRFLSRKAVIRKHSLDLPIRFIHRPRDGSVLSSPIA